MTRTWYLIGAAALVTILSGCSMPFTDGVSASVRSPSAAAAASATPTTTATAAATPKPVVDSGPTMNAAGMVDDTDPNELRYTVVEGDTIYAIASRFGVDLLDIKASNFADADADYGLMQVGDVLTISRR